MKRAPALTSASGLRPMSAFVVVASVVLVVGGRVALLSAERQASQPDRVVREERSAPSFRIEDAGGRTLARCVPRFDLVMSPRSMWQAHTPERIARRLSEALGGDPAPSDLLAQMLPDAVDGEIEVDAWKLSARQAYLLDEWIAGGAGSGKGPLRGISVRSTPASGARIAWRPATLLAREERELHGYSSAWAWARHLANGLARCVGILRGAPDEDVLAAVWGAMLPSGYCRPVEGIPSERVLEVRDLLRSEGVSPWQMRIAYERDRVYPSGRDELFGSWGFTRPDQTQPEARNGLELLCSRLLAGDEWSFLDREGSVYTWLQDRAVRGERANAFLDFRPESQAPVVRSTIDLDLMRDLRRELTGVMERHRPALAMGIVVDVATGDVLAVDSLEAYDVQPFAPVYHTFTPGSTFKLVTMSVALQEKAVTPETRFDVGDHQFRLVDPRTGRSRIIHEAEGSRTGVITAAEALACSVNAGLAQIGLRVPDEVFRSYLVPLGYGREPGAGLGVEAAGYLPTLPWTWLGTHASICFGHELTTTLWQHAMAIATILRGGEMLPLRLLEDVEQDGGTWPIPGAQGQRVFSPETCREVRAMMALGASEGTGDEAGEHFLELAHAAGWPDAGLADFGLGTKTGTAQKVDTEICLHVELRERQRCREQGIPWTRALYRSLRGMPKPHKSCYTSSMCAVAHRPDDGRDVMVLIVADEPRGKERFGARVAGEATIDVLADALRITRDGRVGEPEVVPGFAAATTGEENPSAQPWRGGDS